MPIQWVTFPAFTDGTSWQDPDGSLHGWIEHMPTSYTLAEGFAVPNLGLARLGIENALRWATTLASLKGDDDTDNDNPDYPVVNVTRPDTYQTWRPLNPWSKLRATWSTPETIDYVAIARHNFGSAVQTGGSFWVTPPAGSPTHVFTFSLDTDDPVLIPFAPTEVEAAELRFSTTTQPIAAVVNIGRAVVMPRPLRSTMQPVWLSRQTNVSPQMSAGGEVIGGVVVSRGVDVSPTWRHLPLAFYVQTLKPLAKGLPGCPFFFAWQPDEAPDEVVYGMLDGDATGGHMRNSTRYEFGFNMRGLA